MSSPDRSRERGQILAVTAAVLAFLFVPLSVMVIDLGLVEAAYAQLGETLQAASEDGASQIDQSALRQSGGQRVVLDAAAARATCERSIDTSGLPGIVSRNVTVSRDTVTATASVRVPLLVVGGATITESRSASFLVGG